MRLSPPRRAGCAALSLLALTLPGPGWTLTVDEVWTEMQAISDRAGITQRAASRASGDGTLTLEGVTLTNIQDSTRITTLVDTLILREVGPDTVEVTYPESLSFLVEEDGPAGFTQAEMALDLTGLTTRVTGAPGDMAFHYTAETALLRLTEFVSDEPVDLPELSLTLSGLDVTTRSGPDLTESAGSATALSGRIAVRATDEDAAFQLRLDATAPGFATSGSALQLSAATGADAFLADPTPYRFESRHGGLTLVMGGQIDGEAGGALFSSTGGGSDLAIADGQLTLGSRGEGVRSQVLLPDLPTPLEATVAAMALDLSMPLVPDNETRALALGVTLDALVLDEDLWALADPAGLLPRSPATLELDLTGEGRVTGDFMAPGFRGPWAMTLDALTINRVLLDVAGARITAEGAFAVDTSRPGTVPGLPALSGRLGVTTQGLTALLDSLGELGLLQAPDLMGARMIIAMLTTPGDTPDTLSAEIELKPDGGLVANGMRLR
jgi:hypothetical protein